MLQGSCRVVYLESVAYGRIYFGNPRVYVRVSSFTDLMQELVVLQDDFASAATTGLSCLDLTAFLGSFCHLEREGVNECFVIDNLLLISE